jgi:hypothetical protein
MHNVSENELRTLLAPILYRMWVKKRGIDMRLAEVRLRRIQDIKKRDR